MLGLITSYTDIKYGKIKNIHTCSGFILGLIITLVLTVSYWIGGRTVNLSYIYDYLLNIFISLIAGFILWWYGFWSSGDAKLFIAFSSLVPLNAYANTYLDYFPALILLVNTFVPFFIVLLVVMLVKRKISFHGLNKLNRRMFMIFLVVVMAGKLLVDLLDKFYPVKNWLIYYGLVLLMYFIIERVIIGISSAKFSYILSFLLIALMFIADVFINNFSLSGVLLFFAGFLGIVLMLLIARFVIYESLINLSHRKVSVDKLQPGDVLGQRIYKKAGKYFVEEDSLLQQPKDYLFEQRDEGLTNEELKLLRQLKTAGKLDFSEVYVNQTLHFAHFMFIGVLITLIFKGAFFILFKV